MQSRRTKAIALFSFDEEDKRIIDRHRRTGRVSHTSPGFFQPNTARRPSTAGRAPVAAICFFMNLSNIAAFGGNESQTDSWEGIHNNLVPSNLSPFKKKKKRKKSPFNGTLGE